MQMILLDEGVYRPRQDRDACAQVARGDDARAAMRRQRDIIKFRVLDHHYDHLPLGGGYFIVVAARQLCPRDSKVDVASLSTVVCGACCVTLLSATAAPRTNDAQPLIMKVALKMILEL